MPGTTRNIRYVSSEKTRLEKSSGELRTELIWGDAVRVTNDGGSKVEGDARALHGFVDAKDLGGESLLEFYVIDVGQGDGCLLKTPDGKWHLVDAGKPANSQTLKRNAINLVRWKFLMEMGEKTIKLENVILSHADEDHYGGLGDLFQKQLPTHNDFGVEIQNYYHAGLGKYSQAAELGDPVPGEVQNLPAGAYGIKAKANFLTRLLGDKASFQNPPYPFASNFGILASLIPKVPANVKALDADMKYLPGYDQANGSVQIRILGPIAEKLKGGGRGLRTLGQESRTVNGHSVVLRVDYKKARILLTGDLNAASHRLLLTYHPASEFEVDVAKACHHGAEDIEPDFIKAMGARCTIISSGDNEDYSHPRPILIGASGYYGRRAKGPDEEILTPLVFSTELARSTALGYVPSVKVAEPSAALGTGKTVDSALVSWKDKGDKTSHALKETPIAKDLIYGMVSVRTDGKKILCATMKETGREFETIMFLAGEDAPP